MEEIKSEDLIKGSKVGRITVEALTNIGKRRKCKVDIMPLTV